MIVRDYHGWTLTEAEHDIHNLVGYIRAKGKSSLVQFITGNGEHKKQVLTMMKEYALKVDEQIGNSGCIVAEVE